MYLFFEWFLLCVLRQFMIPLVFIVLAFTLQAVSRGMSRVFTLLLASFPRLIMFFYLCKCPPLLCFSLVLFLLFLGVGFGISLASFWGYLSFVSHAFICFIKSLEPFRMRLGRLFAYLWTELFKTRGTNYHGYFSSYCHIGVYAIINTVIQVNEKFMLA